MILGAVLVGYPLVETSHFETVAPMIWSFQPAFSAQLLQPQDKTGTLVVQASYRGGPQRYEDFAAYIATSHRFSFDVGWRVSSTGPTVQGRWEGGGGVHLAVLRFNPEIWDNWIAWGLGVYTTPSLAFGSGPVRPVVSLPMSASLIPTRLSGGLSVRTQESWHWVPSSSNISLLVGVEWGGKRSGAAPPKEGGSGQ